MTGSTSSLPLDYLDFEVEIGSGQGRNYPLTVVRSPAGEAREVLRFPFDTLALENRLQALELALLRAGGYRRRLHAADEQTVQDLGRALFDALLTGDVRSRYDISRREAAASGKGLRLKLRIVPPELAALPWEFMYDPRMDEFVGLSLTTPIVRYPVVGSTILPLLVQPPLRLLVIVAAPHNLPPLDIQRERKRIEVALERLRTRGLVEITWLEGQTWRDLQRAMRAGPWHIVHFVGHGGFDRETDEGLVAFAGDGGQAAYLTATALGRLLADHFPLRLVVLNACEGARGSERDIFSSTAAILVRRGIPAVLAMQYAITDDAAIEFSQAFYDAVADGLPLDAAVAEARKAISMAIVNTLEWGTPVLFLRSPDGRIFDIARSADVAPAQRPNVVATEPAPAQPDPAAVLNQQLAADYAAAQRAVATEEWERAYELLTAIERRHPGYQDTAALLKRATRATAPNAPTAGPAKSLADGTAPEQIAQPAVPPAGNPRWGPLVRCVVLALLGTALTGTLLTTSVIRFEENVAALFAAGACSLAVGGWALGLTIGSATPNRPRFEPALLAVAWALAWIVGFAIALQRELTNPDPVVPVWMVTGLATGLVLWRGRPRLTLWQIGALSLTWLGVLLAGAVVGNEMANALRPTSLSWVNRALAGALAVDTLVGAVGGVATFALCAGARSSATPCPPTPGLRTFLTTGGFVLGGFVGMLAALVVGAPESYPRWDVWAIAWAAGGASTGLVLERRTLPRSQAILLIAVGWAIALYLCSGDWWWRLYQYKDSSLWLESFVANLAVGGAVGGALTGLGMGWSTPAPWRLAGRLALRWGLAGALGGLLLCWYPLWSEEWTKVQPVLWYGGWLSIGAIFGGLGAALTVRQRQAQPR